jgi:hypothetical protein
MQRGGASVGLGRGGQTPPLPSVLPGYATIDCAAPVLATSAANANVRLFSLVPPALLEVELASPPQDPPAPPALPLLPLPMASPPARAISTARPLCVLPLPPPAPAPSSRHHLHSHQECHIKMAGTYVGSVENTTIINATFIADFVTLNNLLLRFSAE